MNFFTSVTFFTED